MNEKKIILTEEQLDEALRFAAMGGAGLLRPDDANDTLKKLPEEVGKKVLSSALAAGVLRKGDSMLAALKTIVKAAATEKNNL